MPAGTFTANRNWKLKQVNGVDPVDFDNDTFKLMLLVDTYVIDQAHEFISDVVASEVATGTAYVAGGPTLAALTVALNGDVVEFDASNVVIAKDAASGFLNAQTAALYKSTGLATTDRIIGWGDLGATKNNVDGVFEFEWAATGILNW